VVAGVLDFAGVGVVFNHSVLQGNRFVFCLILALPPLLFYLAFPPHSPP
jgi:hypothetical protein